MLVFVVVLMVHAVGAGLELWKRPGGFGSAQVLSEARE